MRLDELIRDTRLYAHVRRWRVARAQRGALERWESAGRPWPPPQAFKHRLLREIAQRHGLHAFVETGTYYGDTIAALRPDFDQLVSIELSPALARRAQRRFSRDRGVRVLQGDSGDVMPDVLASLPDRALFWLDGHYSGGETACGAEETPIFRELGHILGSARRGDVIVIDDARLFGTDPAYPTVEQTREYVARLRPDLAVALRDDVMIVADDRET